MKILFSNGEPVQWQRGGQKDVLTEYVRLHEKKIGMHWLWAAILRINQGEKEADVLRDYGYEMTTLRVAGSSARASDTQ